MTIKPTLLGMNTQDVHVLTTGTGGMGQQLRMRNEQPVSEGCPKFRWRHGQGLGSGSSSSGGSSSGGSSSIGLVVVVVVAVVAVVVF